MAAKIETDALIVGSGPAGGASAALLATFGVRHVMITKYGWLADTPRAHITNQRAMEVFRDFGIEDQVIADATPQALMGNNVFCDKHRRRGDRPAVLTWGTHPARKADYELRQPDAGSATCRRTSWSRSWSRPPASAAPRSASTPNSSSLEPGRRRRHRRRSRTGSPARRYKIRAKYLIGADGGRAAGRRGHRPADAKARWASPARMNIIFKADISQIRRPPAERALLGACSPGADVGGIGAGLVRMVRPWHEWLIVWGYDINAAAAATSPTTRRPRSSRNLVGDQTLEVEITGDLDLDRQQRCMPLTTRGAGVLRRRRGAPSPAVQRPRLQHLDPGLLQPGLEARAMC